MIRSKGLLLGAEFAATNKLLSRYYKNIGANAKDHPKTLAEMTALYPAKRPRQNR